MVMNNMHIVPILQSSIKGALVSGAISAVLGASMLPIVLATAAVTSFLPAKSEIDARDFFLYKLGSKDISWPESEMIGYDVLSTNDGEVVSVFDRIRNNDKFQRQEGIKTGGNMITIKHNGFYSLYAHLSYGSVKVDIGDKVKKGQKIAEVGDTGHSFAPHLHFELCSINPNILGGLLKPMTGFEPYKYMPIPLKEVFSAKSLKEQIELLERYSKKSLIIDDSGVLDSYAFIS